MDLSVFFKSVIDQDHAAVVICSLDHTVVYMNPAAVRRYSRDLTGSSILRCHNSESCAIIEKVLKWFSESPQNNIVFESYNGEENKDNYIVAMRGETGELIGYYEKHEYRNLEHSLPYSQLM